MQAEGPASRLRSRHPSPAGASLCTRSARSDPETGAWSKACASTGSCSSKIVSSKARRIYGSPELAYWRLLDVAEVARYVGLGDPDREQCTQCNVNRRDQQAMVRRD